MAKPPKKMSEMLKEMSEHLLRDPDRASLEAAHVALMFAHIAWNETVGLGNHRNGLRSAWETIAGDNHEMWGDFKTNDVDAMINELVEFKNKHFPEDQRRILACSTTPQSTLRVEWLAPAAPRIDARWEMQLFGLVRTGEREEAIRFLRESRSMSRKEAAKKVATIAAQLGLL